MTDADKMERVICGHHWDRIDEWVDCLFRLADLSDEEITQLVGSAGALPPPIPASL